MIPSPNQCGLGFRYTQVEEALKSHGRLRLFYEIAADFAGIEPGAIWKDFKVGMEHITRWERMAVVTDVDWIKHTIRFFRFLMPGKIKYSRFPELRLRVFGSSVVIEFKSHRSDYAERSGISTFVDALDQ